MLCSVTSALVPVATALCPTRSARSVRKRVTESVRMDVFSDRRTVSLDDVAHLSLFEGKNRLIIGNYCANTCSESISTVSSSK